MTTRPANRTNPDIENPYRKKLESTKRANDAYRARRKLDKRKYNAYLENSRMHKELKRQREFAAILKLSA